MPACIDFFISMHCDTYLTGENSYEHSALLPTHLTGIDFTAQTWLAHYNNERSGRS